MTTDKPSPNTSLNNDALWRILEGTAMETGAGFFTSLVENMVSSLKVNAAWVTEFFQDAESFKTLAFYMNGKWIDNFEYAMAKTPCEKVTETECLVHIPDNITILFPDDPDLKNTNFVSYMGVPLLNLDGKVIGHLAIMDTKPMPKEPKHLALFQLFASRAAAEYQRLHSEEKVRAREDKLNRVVNSAFDAIIELDEQLNISLVNSAAEKLFNGSANLLAGKNFKDLLAPESHAKFSSLIKSLEDKSNSKQYLWIADGLLAVCREGKQFRAEASLSRSQVDDKIFYSLILRNADERLNAERKIQDLSVQSDYLKEEIKDLLNFDEIIGRSKALQQVLVDVSQVAGADTTVLIHGETGTGKEVIARAVHAASSRSEKPLIKVNCAAIPANLIESEFFGHEKGSFTGATAKRNGRFALANEGTIFLDEIGELPIDLQAKLLRVIQEGEFEPLGSSKTVTVDVRIIAATNRDLPQEIKDGKFREDLYYRLSVFPIQLPPLRERGEDIILMAQAFVKKFAQKTGKLIEPLSEDMMRRLKNYSWPGNVRELENVIERAVITSRDGHLNLVRALPSENSPKENLFESNSDSEKSQSIRTVHELLELERANIIAALEKCDGRIAGEKGASQLLCMNPSTLRSRIKALDIKQDS